MLSFPWSITSCTKFFQTVNADTSAIHNSTDFSKVLQIVIVLHLLLAANTYHKELSGVQQHSLPIHRHKAIKYWVRDYICSMITFSMWFKSMENSTQTTVHFKLSSKDLHTRYTDRIIWSVLQKCIWLSNTSKNQTLRVTIHKQHFGAKYSRISVLKIPGAPALQVWIARLQSIFLSILAHSTEAPKLAFVFGAHRHNRRRWRQRSSIAGN